MTSFVDFSPPVTGTGVPELTIPFPSTTMKAVRILQTGTTLLTWWSINELTVGGCQPR